MALRKPKNAYERKLYKDGAIASFQQELDELVEKYPTLEDLYYDTHMGVWVVKTADNEWEALTKEEALSELEVHFTENYVASPEEKELFTPET